MPLLILYRKKGNMNTLVLIPCRLSATRLPGKPLLKINGLSMISHVFNKAKDANLGEVFVATEDQEIFDEVKKNGGQAIMTSNEHKTGTDRIYEAIKKLDMKNIDLIMNLQGDEPLMDVEDMKNLNQRMINSNSDIGTLASKIREKKKYQDTNIVKVTTEKSLDESFFPSAVNFSRKADQINTNIYHHLGIYCYRLNALESFVSFDQSSNEIKEKLEQLRALDNNIKINVALAKSAPIGVDTQEDFIAIKKIMEYKSK